MTSITKQQESFMREAIREAFLGLSKKEGMPFGAVIVKKGKIISKAHNTVSKEKNPTSHAEINAIRKASKKLKSYDLSGCEIYSSCEPCPMCFSAIHWARIKSIYFGTRVIDSRRIGFNELEISNETMKRNGKSRIKIVGGVLRKESLELFKEFQKSHRKPY